MKLDDVLKLKAIWNEKPIQAVAVVFAVVFFVYVLAVTSGLAKITVEYFFGKDAPIDNEKRGLLEEEINEKDTKVDKLSYSTSDGDTKVKRQELGIKTDSETQLPDAFNSRAPTSEPIYILPEGTEW